MTLRALELARRRTEQEGDGTADYTLKAQESRGQVNDHELWCDDIDFLLNEADSELGSHGTFGGFLSTMERGGPDGGGVTSVAPPRDSVLGTSVRCAAGLAEGSVARERRIRPIFEALPREARAIHVARYRPLREVTLHPGAEGKLGYLAGVVFLAHDDKNIEKILSACQQAAKVRIKGRAPEDPPIIKRALKVAEALVRAAHRSYWRLVSAA